MDISLFIWKGLFVILHNNNILDILIILEESPEPFLPYNMNLNLEVF